MSILEKTANEPVGFESGTAIKFVRPGEAVLCQFQKRKTGIKTKLSTGDDDLASVTNVLIVDTNINGLKPGENGAIWEGTHVRQIMEEQGLQPGEGFILRFAETTKNRFKRFYFKKVTSAELEAEAKAKGVTLSTDVPF